MQARHNQPVSVNHVHEEYGSGDDGQRDSMFFDSPKQEQKERNEEVKCGEARDNEFPAAGNPMQIPINLRREITGINNQQLPKRDVSPEHYECEQQIAEVMIMRLGND